VLQVLNFANNVVVKLQLLQALKASKVVDLNDIFVGERQVLEVPKRVLVLVIDLILSVELNNVLPIMKQVG
jgi:hypothetical protein|tara:strand:- start:328 stop:540 length:213 start_codon:yes stop_codon:yes gene_type:complete